ncbi:MAG: hypothetical protein RMI34_10145 [Chloroherpetonaceae bacterium]|nr:hypothetical protein [Chloroherpetonaceae bacterium]MCS7211161.1 hypothetical protein [Chloroherpetonaceae bacterium]MDW8020421.1 hypothetical protein [Chloroherpetonaceae bacterium]MDW8465785.1 hypothetical protein [Chloroherpetonaceae bacterium]
MTRRGFLSKLFGKKYPDEMAFFAVQVAFNYYGKETLRSALHRLIEESVDDETPEQKRRFYKRLTGKLQEAIPYFEYGYWDFIIEAEAAEREFHHWINDIEANIATEEEEVGESVDEVMRLSSSKYYVVISLIFLLEASPMLNDLTDMIREIPEDAFADRETFAKLISAINYIDFEYSYGDAVYIMPSNEKDGISYEDLAGEGWEYLQLIS